MTTSKRDAPKRTVIGAYNAAICQTVRLSCHHFYKWRPRGRHTVPPRQLRCRLCAEAVATSKREER